MFGLFKRDEKFDLPDIASLPELSNEWRAGSAAASPDMIEALNSDDLGLFIKALRKVWREAEINVENESVQKLEARIKSIYRMLRLKRVEGEDSKLQKNGYLLHKIDIHDLNIALDDQITTLRNSENVDMVGRFDRSEEISSENFQLLKALLEQSGVMKTVRSYDDQLDLGRAVLHISKPDDKHWRQFLGDCAHDTSLTNMHFDPKKDIKAIIYLNDVAEENGAFGIVKGSHKFKRSFVQDLMSRSIATGNYCDSPESRKIVFALPSEMRVSANFGRLINDGSPQSKFIFQRMKYLDSKTANCVVFKSGDLFHRGGVCHSGERHALQLIFRAGKQH